MGIRDGKKKLEGATKKERRKFGITTNGVDNDGVTSNEKETTNQHRK